MKRIWILLLSFFLVGCGNEQKNIDLDNNNVSTNSNNLYSATYTEYKNMAMGKQGSLETDDKYETLADAAADSEYVVYGKITDVFYQVKEGIISTVENFEVIQCYRGELSPGDSISMISDGGYVTVKNYLDSFTDEELRNAAMERCATFSEEEKKIKYIGMRNEGELDVQKEEKRICCLKPSVEYENTGYYTATVPGRTCFIEVGDDTFLKESTIANAPSSENAIRLYSDVENTNELEAYESSLEETLEKLNTK